MADINPYEVTAAPETRVRFVAKSNRRTKLTLLGVVSAAAMPALLGTYWGVVQYIDLAGDSVGQSRSFREWIDDLSIPLALIFIIAPACGLIGGVLAWIVATLRRYLP